MEGIRFESKTQKDEQRSLKREAQQHLLIKAEKEFYRQKHREEKKKEQSWMLPAVSSRLEQADEEGSKTKSKKHKKSKKAKKHKTRKRGESDSEHEKSEVDEWVEKDAGTESTATDSGKSQPKLERDSWMSLPANFVPTLSRAEIKLRDKGCRNAQKEEELKKLALHKPGQHARELNPYWKDGGTGLPEDAVSNQESLSNATDVGDGGLRWLRQALRRAEEQAREEDRTLEEVAAERWGSLEKLKRMLEEAEIRHRRGKDNDDKSRFRDFESRNRHSRHTEKSSPRGTYSRYQRETSSSSRSTPRGMFMPPKNDEDEEEPRMGRSVKPASATHSRWRKKEFVEEKPQQATISPIKTINKSPVDNSDGDGSSSESSDAAEVQPPPKQRSPSPVRKLTDKEMNELGAKLVKAELMGNTELVSSLKAKLEAARKSNSEPGSNNASKNNTEEVVILTRTDSRGMSRPLSEPEFPYEPSKGRKKKQKVETHDQSGKRDRYFADDDKYSLKQMFEREKLGTAEDQNAMFARLAGKGLDPTNEDYDVDDVFVNRANNKANEAKLDAQERLYAINEHKRSSAALERCCYCFDGKNMSKHLIAAIGMKVYLCLPQFQSLTDGHCLIVPMQHVSAATYLDEDVWSEVKIFRKGLTKMFEQQERDVVFFETSMHLKSYPHMVIQCVPLPKDVGNLAPMYFKKAILESETEWAHNKKLVDLSQKGIHRAVPKGLPYFSVDFGLDDGFAHVIEDEQLFPKNFAQSIIGGMLDLDPNTWRKPGREKFNDQCKKVLQFAEWWKPYDWTQRLKDK